MGTFEQHKTSSTYWHNTANHLHISAAAIYHAMELEAAFPKDRFGLSEGVSMWADSTGAFRMLCGMSLECLLKGILQEQGQKLKKSHTLPELAKLAGVTFSPDDTALLQILSEAVYWDGRYPYPLEESHWNNLNGLVWEHLHDKEPLGDTGLSTYQANDKLDWEGYDRLWLMVLGELSAIASWLDRS